VAGYNLSSHSEDFQAASQGFLDNDERPPCDTWLWMLDVSDDSHPVLLSWVPRAFEERVDAAIDLSPDGVVFWLDDMPQGHPQVKAFRAATTRELEIPRPWRSTGQDVLRAPRRRRRATD
jgi:hypothetical protein